MKREALVWHCEGSKAPADTFHALQHVAWLSLASCLLIQVAGEDCVYSILEGFTVVADGLVGSFGRSLGSATQSTEDPSMLHVVTSPCQAGALSAQVYQSLMQRTSELSYACPSPTCAAVLFLGIINSLFERSTKPGKGKAAAARPQH
jgi:hypothetical protein